MHVSPRSAAKHFNVNELTLRRWAADGKIEHKRTEGGHHRYLLKPAKESKRKVIYARVSSSKQSEDLDRQIKYMRRRYPKYEVISDIGGGANFNRKGLRSLLESVCKGEVGNIAVYSRDRLTRFGGELIEYICSIFGARILYAESEEGQDGNSAEELSKDLLTIITHFTARYYGSRKYAEDD